jgi:hypothetical protein
MQNFERFFGLITFMIFFIWSIMAGLVVVLLGTGIVALIKYLTT